jgi:hypothetical protein
MAGMAGVLPRGLLALSGAAGVIGLALSAGAVTPASATCVFMACGQPVAQATVSCCTDQPIYAAPGQAGAPTSRAPNSQPGEVEMSASPLRRAEPARATARKVPPQRSHTKRHSTKAASNRASRQRTVATSGAGSSVGLAVNPASGGKARAVAHTGHGTGAARAKATAKPQTRRASQQRTAHRPLASTKRVAGRTATGGAVDYAAVYSASATGASTPIAAWAGRGERWVTSTTSVRWIAPSATSWSSGSECGWGARVVSGPGGHLTHQRTWLCACPQGWRPPGT